RPGVLDVRASPFLPTSALISDDLPTLERPAKAISAGPSGGRNLSDGTPRMNTHGWLKRPRAASLSTGVVTSVIGFVPELLCCPLRPSGCAADSRHKEGPSSGPSVNVFPVGPIRLPWACA